MILSSTNTVRQRASAALRAPRVCASIAGSPRQRSQLAHIRNAQPRDRRGIAATAKQYRESPSFSKRDIGQANIPQVSFDNTAVTLAWPDGIESRFDNHFLYDHCRCASCFHPGTKQRLKTLNEIPLDVHATAVEIDSSAAHVTWSTPSPHQSSFPLRFLRRASYDPPLPLQYETEDTRVLWSSKIVQSPPTVTHEDITHEKTETKERAILKLLDRVHDFGFCFVTGVPPTPEQTKNLIETIAPIRETHYGGFWDFTADMSHGDLAYSAQALPAHTDTTYFTDPAGLQIFHLLSHPSPPGSGGTTLLVDAFYTASLLSTLYPTSYSLLSRLRVPAHASGTPGTLLRPPISQPVFRHNERGQLVQVRWNNEDRGVLGQGWTADEIRGWYQAAQRFDNLNRSEDAEYWVQLNPGTVLVIDNWRVMHGRSDFTGERRMCGAYVGADDWLSRRAALRSKSPKRKETDQLWTMGW